MLRLMTSSPSAHHSSASSRQRAICKRWGGSCLHHRTVIRYARFSITYVATTTTTTNNSLGEDTTAHTILRANPRKPRARLATCSNHQSWCRRPGQHLLRQWLRQTQRQWLTERKQPRLTHHGLQTNCYGQHHTHDAIRSTGHHTRLQRGHARQQHRRPYDARCCFSIADHGFRRPFSTRTRQRVWPRAVR